MKIEVLLLMAVAYLVGSIPTAYLAARVFKGVDIRAYGSGSVGGSNIGELMGVGWTVAVGVFDLLKGLVLVLAARFVDPSTAIWVGLAVVFGHNWSVYLGFVGGRGMASALGALAVVDYRLALLILVSLGLGRLGGETAVGGALGWVLLAPAAWLLGNPAVVGWGCFALTVVAVVKRLEANRAPLPPDWPSKKAVILRRLFLDRDVLKRESWVERQPRSNP